MKVSEKQLLVLFDALRVVRGLEGPWLCAYSKETREAVFVEIINQQSDVLVDVNGEEPKEVGP